MDRPSKRFRLLIDELANEVSRKRGWKTAVAKKLGVDQSFLSRLISGERDTVSPRVLARAAKRLEIDEAYFYSPRTPITYREFPRLAPQTTRETPRAKSAATPPYYAGGLGIMAALPLISKPPTDWVQLDHDAQRVYETIESRDGVDRVAIRDVAERVLGAKVVAAAQFVIRALDDKADEETLVVFASTLIGAIGETQTPRLSPPPSFPALPSP